MKTIAFFLEELSARVMLEEFIKVNFPLASQTLSLCYKVHEGKQDLENHPERRLRGWRTPDTVFVVMRDQDSGDCVKIKTNLQKICERAGRAAVIRVACHELESFYLGDSRAVEKGLEVHAIHKSSRRKMFHNPDAIQQPSKMLEAVTKGKYQKIDGSRRIAPFMDPTVNRSRSFRVLYKSLCELLRE
jgi:hypothetical protein